MTSKRRVYLLDRQLFSPQTIATIIAKTSRSPQPFDEIANEISESQSQAFQERWVMGFGHDSIAEHAVVHIAIENVSRLAIETLETARLASFTEKSTRYQVWDSENLHIPQEILETPLEQEYRDCCTQLIDTYNLALEKTRAIIMQRRPQKIEEKDEVYERRIRPHYVDSCRYLLPSSALANVGMTINARALIHTLKKMLSHPLLEVNNLGEEICRVAQVALPAFTKAIQKSDYLEKVSTLGEGFASVIENQEDITRQDFCHLIHYENEAENQALASFLVQSGNSGYEDAKAYIESLSNEGRLQMLDAVLRNLENSDQIPRFLEMVRFSFEILLDQGAFYELKRHRMATLIPQKLGVHLGYAIPRLIFDSGIEDQYCTAMEKAKRTSEKLEKISPWVASYIVPNAFLRRTILDINFRSLFHLIDLRSSKAAHFAIRRIALKLAEEIEGSSTLLGKFIHKSTTETWQSIEQDFFSSTCI